MVRRGATGGLVGDWRKVLDRVAVRAWYKPREIRPRMFRHTYRAARLQTLDGAAPMSPYTVRREMGHGSQAMVDKVYRHLGVARHRSPVVEYRVEQHVSILGDRLTALLLGAPPGLRARVWGRTVSRTVAEAGAARGGAVCEVAEVAGSRAGAGHRGL